MKHLAWLLICLSCLEVSVATAAEPGKHVRVILDISKSMRDTTTARGNDPKRLAKLSAILLFDLTRPNSRIDTFKVFPFEEKWTWNDPKDPPPKSTRPAISAANDTREDFKRKITDLEYNSEYTYFYPGLDRAISELTRTPEKEYDQRLIVLITDGLPEDRRPPYKSTAQKERDLLRSLRPKLRENNIILYVLAFGKQAASNRSFFEEITENDRVFIDEDGNELLLNMLKIFAHNFGYDVQDPRGLIGVDKLDLERGIRPNDVAVVVYSNQPQPNLAFDLKTPHGTPANNDLKNAIQTGDSSIIGSSYAISWVSSIIPGDYQFQSNISSQGHYAILRPIVVDLSIEPPVRSIMAEENFFLKVLARTPRGGRPPEVNIVARKNGPPGDDWSEKWEGPSSPNGSPYNNGLLYKIPLTFPEDTKDPHKMYTGRIEVVARSSRAKVGEIGGNNPYLVDVYPFLKITPHPDRSHVIASQGPLTAEQQNVCDRFSFKTLGHLPENPPYSVRAVLQPSDSKIMDGEFKGASFSLDGIPLYFNGRGTNKPDSWDSGHALSKSELLDDKNTHQICIKAGQPTTADPKVLLKLPVKFTLMLDPYKNIGGVTEDYMLELKLAEPGWLDQWRDLIFLGLFTGSLLTLIWYTRDRPTLAPDLGYAIAPEESADQLAFRDLGTGSWLARLLGLVVERPVTADSSGRALAWVRPVDGELYQLRLAKGAVIEALDAGEPVPTGPGLAPLMVQRLYRLRTDSGAYRFRMEYRSPDSRVG